MENLQIMNTRISTRLAAVFAGALVGLAGTAFAQPSVGHGHGHGYRGGGGDVVMAIVHLKEQLNLNTAQQAMWDNAVAASKAARETARTNAQNVEQTLRAELAKPEPDLAAVAAAADAARSANAAVHTQVRAAWLNIYGTFTPEQKTVVKNALLDRMSQMEKFREKMRARRSQGG
jgi:Spy/CpxP family protein refolding chaperone